jgi:ornithine carbamoyltransferase
LWRGRKFGLMCSSDAAALRFAARLEGAAAALGGQVSHLRPSLGEASPEAEMRLTAHMLGRLYDAVFCIGIAPAVVRDLAAAAGVPVYGRLDADWRLVAEAAALPGNGDVDRDTRHFLLQALLLSKLGP